ncbi:putative ATP synthase subunit f, mitochondrial [Liolophura sinensis]|uniref:putative ATP synthase subunit f, mitochondrial n=1 Tax=Liolophura sinensis TaxID=3198878 RepID=UPI0031589FC2
MGIGEYPPEFNPKIHGPYNPARYYGKPDASLGEVKVGELGSWLARRNWTPAGMAGGISRAYWRWAQKWLLVKRGSMAPIAQSIVGLSVFYYFLQYKAHTNHRHFKYH